MSGATTSRLWILLAIAAAIGVYLFMVPPPGEEVAEAVVRERPAAESATAANASQEAAAGSVAEPATAFEAATGETAPDGDAASSATGTSRVTASTASDALFAVQSWVVAPPPPPPPPAAAPPPPPPPPTAPPLPFAFMGSYVRQGEKTVYVLAQGDKVYDLHVGDDIDENYHFDSVAEGKLLLTYKPLKQQQTLATGDGQ